MLTKTNYFFNDHHGYKYDFEKNFAKWKTLGSMQHTYATHDVLNFKNQNDAKDFLKNWLNSRISYLKNTWKKGA